MGLSLKMVIHSLSVVWLSLEMNPHKPGFDLTLPSGTQTHTPNQTGYYICFDFN